MSQKPPPPNDAGRWSKRPAAAPRCARSLTDSAWPWPPCSAWVARAKGQRLDRVDWADRPGGLATPVNRTERQREDLVLTIRQELRATSDLGEFGAAAIRREWLARGLPDPP